MYTVLTTDVFDAWFRALHDRMAQRRIQARIDRMEDGNFGDIKPVGQGVSELRIHVGPGYRVYIKQNGTEVIVLLIGGDKSTQQTDIATALALAQHIKGGNHEHHTA
jgi:putative addiction module killer protein